MNRSHALSLTALIILGLVGTRSLADHGTYEYGITPGSHTIDTKRLREYRATWKQWLRTDDGLTDSGATFEEQLEIGGQAINHTQTVRNNQGVVITEQRQFQPDTLLPLSLRRQMENGPDSAPTGIDLRADGRNWSGPVDLPGGKQTAFQYTAEAVAFDGWVAGLTLAALPLTVGYEATLPTVVQLQRTTYHLHVVVKDRSDFKVANQTLPVWVVDTTWTNVADHTVSAGGADQAGGTYLIAVNPKAGQPHVLEYANNGAIIRWTGNR